MNRLKIIATFIFILSIQVVLSQDLIVKKSGARVYCYIFKDDSISLHYRVSGQSMPFQINKTNVRDYFIADKAKKEKQKGVDLVLFDFSLGIANPLRDFGSKDLSKAAAGLANTGYLFHSQITLKLSEYFALSAAYKYQTHTFDHAVIREQLNWIYNTNTFQSYSTNWIIKGFFGGLCFNVPIKSIAGLSVAFDALAGLPKFRLPELETRAVLNGSHVKVVQHSSEAMAPVFIAGMGLIYKISKNIGFRLNVNYLTSKVTFTNILTTTSNGLRTHQNYTQPVSTLNVTGGLVLIISRPAQLASSPSTNR